MHTVTPMHGPNANKPMIMPILVPKGYVNQAPANLASGADQSCLKERTCHYLTIVQPD